MTNFSPHPETLLLTLDEVADHLRCTRRHVERYVAAGDLTVIRLGRAVRVARADLEEFIVLMRDGAA